MMYLPTPHGIKRIQWQMVSAIVCCFRFVFYIKITPPKNKKFRFFEIFGDIFVSDLQDGRVS